MKLIGYQLSMILSFIPRMCQIWPIGTEIWFRKDTQTTPKLYPSNFVMGLLGDKKNKLKGSVRHKWVSTYFPVAKAWAPGHKFEWTTAIENWGIKLDDGFVDHGGVLLYSTSSDTGVSSGGPTSGSAISASSLSSSSSSSNSSSSFWIGFHHTHRPCK